MNTKAVKYIPDGYHTVTAYLTVDDAAKAIDFYAEAFGAVELYRLPMGDMIGHAEVKIGDTHIMLSDEFADMNIKGPNARGGPTAAFMIYVEDADAAFARAIKAGARQDRAVETQFWGDRMGSVIDPFGHKWSLATHVEDVPPEEMQKRMAAWSESQGG
ncbi:MAG TPA: VOC family protein [Dokdonella sp.]|uniref:VOC family protein n=1 Tax=Dokdonella sp. TaxID=2291710 RepID=UPI002D80F901|nr:VOC family protein [Dokdonella sp.]HET9033161.1 VOC family protein [Dokdonella sp.]